MSETQHDNPSIPRDYDKDPIIIEDYNSLFLALWTISWIPVIVYVYIVNPGGTSSQSLSLNIFFILPMMMFPYVYGYLKAKGRRKIVLKNTEVNFLHDSILLEKIELCEVTDVHRTFSDLYHVSQYPNAFGKVMSYLLAPLYLLTNFVFLLYKLFFHIYKDGYKSYRFYDAIIVFSGDKFINILPTTKDEYNEVEEYFSTKKQIELATTKVFYDFFGHMPEKINLEGDK
jgi:hypothetical protein